MEKEPATNNCEVLKECNPDPGLSNRGAKTETSHTWSNKLGNQTANPARILHPETMEDLIQIIQQAKTENKKVRCACNGQTWSSSSVVHGEGYLAIMNKMNKIYDPVHLEGNVWTVEIETGVLVKSLDDLLRNHDPPLALASNVVLDTIRFGGILSLGCHGAATHSRTLPDLAHSVKIIDANGNLNVFSKDVDPVEFSAATVNLGLLGIIYSYTLRVEPMYKLNLVSAFLFIHSLRCHPRLLSNMLSPSFIC
jgi:FAD/FMN-containing dehydrogenase